jgi:hypothetical protein
MREVGQIAAGFSAKGHLSRGRLTLSGRPFTIIGASSTQTFEGELGLGITATGSDGLEYSLDVCILWNNTTWTIQTEAWVDDETVNERLIRELPARNAADLDTCLTEVAAAVSDLRGLGDLLEGKHDV